ncbi:MAG: hypothetical protein ACHQT9_02775 [Candidatus Saccharimonadales bacterium]
MYSERKGLVSILGGRSEEESEALYDTVREEESILGSLLEANNSRLIRSGLAHKIEQRNLAEADHVLKRYGRAYSRPALISPVTQFQVSRVHAHTPRPGRSEVNPDSVCVNLLVDPTHTIIYEIGSRVMAGGEVIEVKFEPFFEEQDVLLAGSLLDIIDSEVAANRLPHLDTTLMNQLHVQAVAT